MTGVTFDLTPDQVEELRLLRDAGPDAVAMRPNGNLVRRGMLELVGQGRGYRLTRLGLAALRRADPAPTMRHLIAVYDTADLSGTEVDYLGMEACVQAEPSDGWPGCGHAGVEARTVSFDALDARLVALGDEAPTENEQGIPLALLTVHEAFQLGVAQAVGLIRDVIAGNIQVSLAEEARR